MLASTGSHLRFLVACLVALAPATALAQRSPRCGSDSVFAKAYGMHLQTTLRQGDSDSATVAWLPDSASCQSAMRADSSGPGHRIYVYAVARAGVLRYGILSVPPPETKVASSVCFYDAVWRQRGVCLGVVR